MVKSSKGEKVNIKAGRLHTHRGKTDTTWGMLIQCTANYTELDGKTHGRLLPHLSLSPQDQLQPFVPSVP